VHCLSGSLPHDLNRAVRQLHDIRVAQNVDKLADLARALVKADLDLVAQAQLHRLASGEGEVADTIRTWLVNARYLPVEAASLMGTPTRYRLPARGPSLRTPSSSSEVSETFWDIC